MFLWGMLAGAGTVILLEIGIAGIFGWNLGKEICEQQDYKNNIIYPADDSNLKGEE